jgi:hypothetical protein
MPYRLEKSLAVTRCRSACLPLPRLRPGVAMGGRGGRAGQPDRPQCPAPDSVNGRHPRHWRAHADCRLVMLSVAPGTDLDDMRGGLHHLGAPSGPRRFGVIRVILSSARSDEPRLVVMGLARRRVLRRRWLRGGRRTGAGRRRGPRCCKRGGRRRRRGCRRGFVAGCRSTSRSPSR